MNRIEVIGAATLYLGDCREILPTLPKMIAGVFNAGATSKDITEALVFFYDEQAGVAA